MHQTLHMKVCQVFAFIFTIWRKKSVSVRKTWCLLLVCLQNQRAWIEKTFQKRECIQIIPSKDPSRYWHIHTFTFILKYNVNFNILLNAGLDLTEVESNWFFIWRLRPLRPPVLRQHLFPVVSLLYRTSLLCCCCSGAVVASWWHSTPPSLQGPKRRRPHWFSWKSNLLRDGVPSNTPRPSPPTPTEWLSSREEDTSTRPWYWESDTPQYRRKESWIIDPHRNPLSMKTILPPAVHQGLLWLQTRLPAPPDGEGLAVGASYAAHLCPWRPSELWPAPQTEAGFWKRTDQSSRDHWSLDLHWRSQYRYGTSGLKMGCAAVTAGNINRTDTDCFMFIFVFPKTQ